MSVTVDKQDLERDNLAKKISVLWSTWDNQRQGKINPTIFFKTGHIGTNNRNIV